MLFPSQFRPNAPAARVLRCLLWGCIAGLGAGSALAASVPVRVQPLDEVLEVPWYSAPATVVARNAPRLAAEIDARLLDLAVAVGDRVSTGQVLARLDCRRFESVLASAEATLARAQAQERFARQQLRRARNLKKKKNISEELLNQRGTELSIAQADRAAGKEAVRQARIDVGQCALLAPFAAVVTERVASTGDYLSRGQVILALLETAGQEVSVALRQDQVISFLDADQKTFESNGQSYQVRNRAVLPLADAVARTREARLGFVDETAIVGTAGRVVWRGPRSLLPADFLVRRDDRLGVFVLDAETAHFVALPDAQDGRPVAVALAPGTLLITEGRQRLRDGDPVQAAPAEVADR